MEVHFYHHLHGSVGHHRLSDGFIIHNSSPQSPNCEWRYHLSILAFLPQHLLTTVQRTRWKFAGMSFLSLDQWSNIFITTEPS